MFQPGDHPEDYRYLFNGYPDLLTEVELKAKRNLLMQEKLKGRGLSKEEIMESKWLHREPEVLAVLENGSQEFYRRTMARVLSETPSGLNTCPKCGSLCRTSKACLCLYCSHTWYGETD